MKNHLTLAVAFWSCISVAGASAAHAADPAPSAPAADCEYLPGEGVIVSSVWSTAPAIFLRAEGCKPQCVGLVYCGKDHPDLKARGSLTIAERIEHGKTINCDANPMVDPTTASCPPPDECMAQARAQSFRQAKPVSPSKTGPSHYVRASGRSFEVRYGLDRVNPDKQIPLYTFPANDGHASHACHVCASFVTLAEKVEGFTICGAKGKKTDQCGNANACATERDSSAGAFQALSVKSSQIAHYDPSAAVSDPTPATADGAQGGSDSP